MARYSIEGYVIIPPVNPWDDKGLVIPQMSYTSFALTPPSAWDKHMHTRPDDKDWSIKVQRWHDKGYRLKKAKLTIRDED